MSLGKKQNDAPSHNYNQNTFTKVVAMVIKNSYIKIKPNDNFQMLPELLFLFQKHHGYIRKSVTC